MNAEKSIREARMMMIVSLLAGVVLLAVALVSEQMELAFLTNTKALLALSLLPISLAFASYLKMNRIKKSPQKMRGVLIRENDERLVSLHNEADAKTFKVMQGALFLGYFGYTFTFPEEVFSSVGWWVLLILLLGSMLVQGVLRHQVCRASSE